MKTIRTFLSHSSDEKVIARKLADELSKYGFDVFVAHDDIVMGEEWENTLKEEIRNRELFIALLSEKFKIVDFADHEIGIAAAYNKRIFPIRLDDLMPYGFMAKFQGSKKINSEIESDEIQTLADSLKSFINESHKIIDALITKFRDVGSFRDTNAVARELFEFKIFSRKQINGIAKIFLENNEVQHSWTAKPTSIDFIAVHLDKIEPKYQEQLKSFLPET